MLCSALPGRCRLSRRWSSSPAKAGRGAGTAQGWGAGPRCCPDRRCGAAARYACGRTDSEPGGTLRPSGSRSPVLTFCGAAGACPSCRPPRTAWAAAYGPAGPALPGRREQPGAGVSGGRAAPAPAPPPGTARHGTAQHGTFARVHRRTLLGGRAAPRLAQRRRQSGPRSEHRPAAATPPAPPTTAQARPGRKGGGGAVAGGGAGAAGAHLRRGAGPRRLALRPLTAAPSSGPHLLPGCR